jgi:hypothetical protein
MAYSELIKNIERIRDYMREFYVYGFKRRDEFGAKSARSYDNERRRIESWLGDYMSFRHDASGKSVFISVDSRAIKHNPLYNAFKAKSFTDKDITLHFYLLDALADGSALTVSEVCDRIAHDYMARFSPPLEFDESTVRNKMREYETLGLLSSEKDGRQLRYRKTESAIDLNAWKDVIAFFSEADPLGIVGSYLLDRMDRAPDYYGFKHHYILHAMESEALLTLLGAIGEKRRVELKIHNVRRGRSTEQIVYPVKIYVSTQNGRQHLLAWNYRFRNMRMFRLDTIRAISVREQEPEYRRFDDIATEHAKRLWGVSSGRGDALDHVEMKVRVGADEQYILSRLLREKRCGEATMIDERTALFTADVYNAEEMLPWFRTFIGRIVSLECNNENVTRTFYADLAETEALYGDKDDVVL